MGTGTSSGIAQQVAQSQGSQLPSRVEQNSELAPTPGMKITNVAKNAFEDTYREARQYLNAFGEREEDADLSMQIQFSGGYVSMKSLRGVQALINSQQKILEMDERLGLMDEKTRMRRLALNAVQRGLNSAYKQHRDYWNGNI